MCSGGRRWFCGFGPGYFGHVDMPVRHAVPQLDTQPFPAAIAEPAAQPDSAGPGTEAFRHWVAADALSSACTTWGPPHAGAPAWPR